MSNRAKMEPLATRVDFSLSKCLKGKSIRSFIRHMVYPGYVSTNPRAPKGVRKLDRELTDKFPK